MEVLMKTVYIKVCGIWLEPIWAVAGTRGSFGSCVLCFDLSPEWEGLQKRVTFFPADGTDAVELILNGDKLIIPDEVMSAAGSAEYVIDGIGASGERLISQKGEVRIVDTAEPGGREPVKRAPDLLHQLRSEIAALRAEIKNLKEVRHEFEVF